MGLLQAFRNALSVAGTQLTQPSSQTVKDIHFSNNFQQKAKVWGLSERDAIDVYHHGSSIEEHKKVKKYNGHELGIWFFTDHLTGQPVITSIWKRGRR
jgi:hypothetical protein